MRATSVGIIQSRKRGMTIPLYYGGVWHTANVMGLVAPTFPASPWASDFGSSVLFDGVDRNEDSQGILIPDGLIGLGDLGSNWTIRSKFRCDGFGAGVTLSSIIGKWTNGNNGAAVNDWIIAVSDAGGGFYTIFVIYEATPVTILQSAPIAVGTLVETALSFDGTTVRLFKNGVIVDSSTVVPRNSNGDCQTWIGRNDYDPLYSSDQPYPLLGAVDETIVESIATTANYTPSTTQFVPDANTILLARF